LTLSDLLDFGLFHDALETLDTDVLDELGEEFAVLSQLVEDLIVAGGADFGAFLEDFSSLLKQFSRAFWGVLFDIRLVIMCMT
jgi:hypothetical protein